MQSEQQDKSTKKAANLKRKPTQPAEFKTEITLQLDEFFRYFNYYYPNKNKEQIITKSLGTANICWITIDSLYYAQNVELQTSRIEQSRKKGGLKNGTFPPTKDSLEQQKFILMVRKLMSENLQTQNIQQIRSVPINQVVQDLESLLIHQQTINNTTIATLQQMLKNDNEQCYRQLEKLDIPIVKSARLFAYEMLEKEVVGKLVEKAMMKEKQPRCDFCFTRDKQIVKCRTCQLYVHPLCFPKAQKMGNEFQCDQCSRNIPENAHCQLCPLFGGTFLQVSETAPAMTYTFTRGQTNVRFKITRHQNQQRERQYIHVSCFVLHPECNYNLSKGGVEGLHRIDRSKKPSCCSVCGNMIGITVSCHQNNCRRAYHAECAKRNNLNINVIKANNKALLQIYCERHKKSQSYEYLKDIGSNRIKELRKFYQNLDFEIKRHGINYSVFRPKKPVKSEEFLKADKCLTCGVQNDYQTPIVNCRRCYGWYHKACNKQCTYCDL